MRARYDASWVYLEFTPAEAPPLSRLVGQMERAMTFRLGERGAVEEEIPVGCSMHPNFDILCQKCRAVFKERGRVRPFALFYPNEAYPNQYLLRFPLGLLPYLLEKPQFRRNEGAPARF